MATSEVNIEGLLFKATNPLNKLEDVNTIKQFCDAVNSNLGGDAAAVACKLLAHKMQSPQEREAVQALAVLEAGVKSCGPVFHAEVGKFKFLNEMIKLVSPKYMASRTPEHIKKKVIELLYLWSTKELKGETKIVEAYAMLKKQKIVKEDPVLGDAVFASALPPRKSTPLSDEETGRLRKLLQSKNPDDLQSANKIIKSMVQEDERKMDAMTKRATELTMVTNNAKLLSEMLDHYDKASCGPEEKELLQELFQSCEKITPKLFRLASETEEDEDLNKILQASDDMSLVISRYKMVILEGKPDVLKDMKKNAERINENVPTSINQDQLLDLDISSPDPAAPASVKKEETFDEDLLGLTLTSENPSSSSPTTESEPKTTLDNETKVIKTKIENLLDDSINLPESSMPVIPIAKKDTSEEELSSPTEDKTSRQRGFEELDFLGESLLKQHLPAKAPQFEKKKEEKLSLNLLQQKQKEKDLIPEPTKEVTETKNDKPKSTENGHAEVKLADLEVPLSSIKPGKTPPMPLQVRLFKKCKSKLIQCNLF